MTEQSPHPTESELRYRDYLEAVTSLFDTLADQDEDDDEPLSEDELDEAEARVRTLFAQHRGTQRAVVGESVAVLTIWQEAQAWLDQQELESVRSPDTIAAPTYDATAPQLTELGYAAQLEIDGDVDTTVGGDGDTAEITVRLTAVGDCPARLLVQITSSDGVLRSAPVNQFGRAHVKAVPLPAADRSLRVDIRRLSA